MTAYNNAGAAAYYAYKAYEIKQAYDFYQQVKDTPQATDAMLTLTTKIAETVGIGIPVWFADKIFTKTGLDRVFDSLRRDKTYEQYLKDQKTDSTLREAGIGLTGELLLDYIRNRTSETGALDPIFDFFSDLFRRAKNWVSPRDPIILDLDGDGLETVGLTSNAYFDHDGDGVLTRTGWAGKDDALLVWDRNTNGAIDTGAELFGDFTPLPNGTLAPNGFAALAALDANGDGILDASDPAFAELKLWRDTSQDGLTGAGELISLPDAGIVSLNLTNTLKNQGLANGNTLAREGSFTRADGTTGGMGEFRLAINTFDTKFAEQIDVPEELKTLPNMQGAGNVRELHQAAAQSGGLQTLLEQFTAAPTRAAQRALLDPLLTAWADTSGMAKNLQEQAGSRYRVVGPMNDLLQSRVHALEAFNGQYFFRLPGEKQQTPGAALGLQIVYGYPVSWRDSDGIWRTGWHPLIPPHVSITLSPQQVTLIGQAYDSLKDSVYASLVMQTRLKPYLDQIELVIDDAGIRLDATALNQSLADKRALDPENALADLLDLDRYAGSFLSGTNWEGLARFDSMIATLPQTPAIAALLADFKVRTLTGGDDAGQLGASDSIVLAGEGDDVLYGLNGAGRLFGQRGDDGFLVLDKNGDGRIGAVQDLREAANDMDWQRAA